MNIGTGFFKGIIVSCFVSSCCQSPSNTSVREKASVESLSQINMKSGVLRIKTDILLEQNGMLPIYNMDSTLFGQILSLEGEPEPRFNKGKLLIREYYPEYYILIFDCKLTNGSYVVKVGNSEKFINHQEGITIYETWDEHIRNSFLLTSNKNPLRSEPNLLSNAFMEYDYSTMSFVVKEVKGDWAKVACDLECEGCGDRGVVVNGWIRWKDGDRLLIELRYVC